MVFLLVLSGFLTVLSYPEYYELIVQEKRCGTIREEVDKVTFEFTKNDLAAIDVLKGDELKEVQTLFLDLTERDITTLRPQVGETTVLSSGNSDKVITLTVNFNFTPKTRKAWLQFKNRLLPFATDLGSLMLRCFNIGFVFFTGSVATSMLTAWAWNRFHPTSAYHHLKEFPTLLKSLYWFIIPEEDLPLYTGANDLMIQSTDGPLPFMDSGASATNSGLFTESSSLNERMVKLERIKRLKELRDTLKLSSLNSGSTASAADSSNADVTARSSVSTDTVSVSVFLSIIISTMFLI